MVSNTVICYANALLQKDFSELLNGKTLFSRIFVNVVEIILAMFIYYLLFFYLMNFITLIGTLAGACTTISFLPQVMKTVKTKHTKDLSLGMFILVVVGMALWLFYGILLSDLPIIIANSMTFVLAFIILVYKIIYK